MGETAVIQAQRASAEAQAASSCPLLGSKSILIHLSRGVLGFLSAAIALKYSSALGWWTLLPAAVALVSFRGCPMCWTVGLVETVLSTKPRPGCRDSSCTES
jgi:hypothetical protein